MKFAAALLAILLIPDTHFPRPLARVEYRVMSSGECPVQPFSPGAWVTFSPAGDRIMIIEVLSPLMERV